MTAERRSASDWNRTVDVYPDGRRFFFYKDDWADRSVVIREAGPSTVTTRVVSGVDWDLHVATNFNADFTYIGMMAEAQRHRFNRIMFLEELVWSHVLATDTAMVADAANDLQRRFAMRGVLNAFEIPDVTAEALALGWIVNSIKPAFDELGLSNVPTLYRPLVRAP